MLIFSQFKIMLDISNHPPPCPLLPQVLIFSQFKIMLDVLEDYLGLAGYPVERVDGSVKGKDRQVGGRDAEDWGGSSTAASLGQLSCTLHCRGLHLAAASGGAVDAPVAEQHVQQWVYHSSLHTTR